MTYLSIIDACGLVFNVRFVRNRRRALSTVVTTALMLTAVAVIGTGVVVWSNTSLRTYEFNLATSASDKTNKINEQFIIENVVLAPNGSPPPPFAAINITVTNTGTVGFNVTQIQVSDSLAPTVVNNNVNLCPYFTCSTIKNAIPPHSSGWFYHTFSWTANKIVTVQVTTVRGTTITTQAAHP